MQKTDANTDGGYRDLNVITEKGQ